MKMIRTALPAALVLVGVLAVSGCGEDAPEHDTDYGGGDGLEVSSLTYGVYQILRSSGIKAEIGPEIRTDYLDKTARGIKVAGGPVLFFEYSDQEDVAKVMASISEDGRTIGDRPVTESGTPHYYNKGKVLAIYFGDREETVEALGLALGPPFRVGTSLK